MMRYKNYLGKVEFDADAKILHGEVAGIRDVVTFQADSVGGIERAFRDSVDDYLAYCQERGEPPDRPASGQFVVRVGSDLHRSLNMLARASGKSLNALVAEYLAREADQAIGDTKPARAAARKQARAARPAKARND